MPKWRLMIWPIIAFNIFVLLVWIREVSSGGRDNCIPLTGEDGCPVASLIGPSVGSVVMWLWVAGIPDDFCGRYAAQVRACIARITSLGAMWSRYLAVVARLLWPSCRWMIGTGTPSIISS